MLFYLTVVDKTSIMQRKKIMRGIIMFFDEEKPIQKFVSTMMDEALSSEKQREKALLEQGNRLLVAQTVLITALVTEIPLTIKTGDLQ